MVLQNWNNLISYIRNKLGAINQLELTDDELINYIKEHTLTEFSNYSSDKVWVLITNADKLGHDPLNDGPDRIMDEDTYKIPLPDDKIDYIINVENAYYRNSVMGDYFNEYPYYSHTDPRDVVMNNTFSTMLDYLGTVQHYQFLPPDTLVFGEKINEEGIILELNIIHTVLDRIKRDIYHGLFKKMALKDTIELIIINRSKFQELSSPFGQINLNIDILDRQKEKLEQEIESYKEWLPPEKLVGWVE